MATIGRIAIALVAGGLFGGAAGATDASAERRPNCRVAAGGKLPAGSGGAAALCAAIERAVAGRSEGTAVQADVRVLSRSMLAATLSVDGRTLPEQRFATMDRDLDERSFERFAAALAEQLAKARR